MSEFIIICLLNIIMVKLNSFTSVKWKFWPNRGWGNRWSDNEMIIFFFIYFLNPYPYRILLLIRYWLGYEMTYIRAIMAIMTGPLMGILWNDNFGPIMTSVTLAPFFKKWNFGQNSECTPKSSRVPAQN